MNSGAAAKRVRVLLWDRRPLPGMLMLLWLAGAHYFITVSLQAKVNRGRRDDGGTEGKNREHKLICCLI